nr:hypothetical protein [Tanacetum cinerariifolium]
MLEIWFVEYAFVLLSYYGAYRGVECTLECHISTKPLAELHVLLEQGKANTMPNKAHMEQKEAPMESHKGNMHEQEQP